MSKVSRNIKKKKRKLNPDELRILKEKQRALYLRQRRKRKQRQLMFQRIRGLFRLAGVLALFLILIYAILIPQWKLNPLIFTYYPNKSLNISNNLITSDNQIISKLKQNKAYEKPLYLVNPAELEEKLLELDPVKEAYVRRYWLPTRLKVTVIERQPLFIIYDSINSLPKHAITTEATKISQEFFPLPEKYQQETFKIILPGPEAIWTQQNVEIYEKIIRIAEKNTGEKLLYMDLTQPGDVYLHMSKSLIRLGGIDATVLERISRLGVIMPAVTPIQNKIEYIDLRWDKALNLKEKVETTGKSEKTTPKQEKPLEQSVEPLVTVTAVETPPSAPVNTVPAENVSGSSITVPADVEN
jgi:cell division septal protein FtsQ